MFVFILIIESSTTIQCPVNYPFAFGGGKQCCKTQKEDTKESQGFDCSVFLRHPHCDSTCDGGDLTIYSNCCENAAYFECPEGRLCINGNEEYGIFFVDTFSIYKGIDDIYTFSELTTELTRCVIFRY